MATSARTSTDRDYVEVEKPQFSTLQSLSKAVHARRAEYTRVQKIKVKIGSWNVAACPGAEKDLAGWFVQGKGVDKRLAGLKIAEGIEDDGSQDHIESVAAQEARRTKKESTIPRGDEGTIVGEADIGLYILGLQEIVDLNSTKEYISKVYTDTGPITKWRRATMNALPPGYELISEQQLSGLLLFIFASPAVAPTISSVSTVSVGTGLMGYLGNKGAVTTRIVLGETTRMVFVNSHLASGNDLAHLERRCWDVSQILQRTRFDPISWAGVLDDNTEGIGEEDFAFWFGDLNFRLDGLPGDDIRRLLMLHTKGEYDVGVKSRRTIEKELAKQDGPITIHSIESEDDNSENESTTRTSSTADHGDDTSSVNLPDPDDFVQDPSQDPGSLQATLDSLLPHDQLRHVQKQKKAFHDGWREGPITFLPTYKYDVGSMGMFDSSEKKRAPSWCDRILFRTRRDKTEYDEKFRDEKLARIKDDEMRARGIDQAGDDEDVLYAYDPDEDGAEEGIAAPNTSHEYDEYDADGDENQGEAIVTKEGFVDRINLDVYTSHQRVLSSDHKPLNAVFSLEYDAVVPELKSKVQQEVARELDRAENETRPGITVVIDRSPQGDNGKNSSISSGPEISTKGVEGVDFGNVSFQKRKRCGLTIANTSQVPCTFAFVERPSDDSGDGDRIAPPWLAVSFVSPEHDEDHRIHKDLQREFALEPGEAINAALEIFINDTAMVRALNEESTKLDDVLVLRVTDGRDHFVPIRGTWLQSCFGRSIDELIRIPEGGVRSLRPRPKGAAGGPVNPGEQVCWSAPRELIKLTEAVEALAERVVADAAMLENSEIPKDVAGWPFDHNTWLLRDDQARENRRCFILEALDEDKSLNDSFPAEIPAIERVEIVAEVLVMFLNSLTDGIIPPSIWAKLESDITLRATTKQNLDVEGIKAWVLDVLSTTPNHNISFVFLTSMLNRVASELAPVSKSSIKEVIASGTRKSVESLRRSLSWKGKEPILPSDPVVSRRKAVEKAYAEVFSHVIFKGPVPGKDKERRIVEERRRDILEAFLTSGDAI